MWLESRTVKTEIAEEPVVASEKPVHLTVTLSGRAVHYCSTWYITTVLNVQQTLDPACIKGLPRANGVKAANLPIT